MQSHIHRPIRASFTATAPNSSRKGFTLIELLVVVTIIGILFSVILVASYDGIRTANLKATQALVLKLDLAVKERMQALLDDEVIPNPTHIWLATQASNKADGGSSFGPLRGLSPGRGGNARAKAIAMTDYLKAEMPDVFVIDNRRSIIQYYPLNFGGMNQLSDPYSSTKPCQGVGDTRASNSPIADYVLPIGTGLVFNGSTSFGTFYVDPKWNAAQVKAYSDSYNYAGTGVFGASYTAAAGLYKQLGYGPAGYDGVDNDGNGLVDEKAEGSPYIWDTDEVDNDADGLIDAQDPKEGSDYIDTLLGNHQHKTARSEMLYALLIEGQGPLGAAFSRDDFTDREIQDTDGDGLLEFVDAWGEPLQFYRWPIWYTSDNQRGWADYPGDQPWFTRERNPIDASNSLVSLDWWSTNLPTFSSTPSTEKNIFEYFFHPLSEASQRATNPNEPSLYFWDRSRATFRRAYRFTPLIVSGGPDLKLGMRMWDPIKETTEALKWPNYPLELIRDFENLGIKFDYYSIADTSLNYSNRNILGFTQGDLSKFDDETLSSADDDISSHALQQGLGGGAR